MAAQQQVFAVLESDLRQLSSDARRSEGFVGWLSGPEHPQIKEAAERALLKLRQCEGKPELVRENKVGDGRWATARCKGMQGRAGGVR